MIEMTNEEIASAEKIVLIEALKQYVEEHKLMTETYQNEILLAEVLIGKLKSSF